MGILAYCGLLATYALVAQRLSSTIVTAPMIFIAAGVFLSTAGAIGPETSEALLHPVAEVALVVLLFLDAAQTDLAALRRRNLWPRRMLLIGMPVAIALGTAMGFLFFGEWSIAAIALAAAILAPTDAALGQAVVTNKAVPIRPRRALTVESGLNDGMALPIILLFVALAATPETLGGGVWLIFAAEQLILGPLAGALIGVVGGWAFLRAKTSGTTADIYEGVGALGLAGAAYLSAILIGGNGFIAAFVAGLAFGAVVKGACRFVFEFTESEGQLLTWTAFFLLGAVLVPDAIANLTWPMFAFILLSLLVIRPVAIWISLIGTDARAITRLFFGWFGPRGLATALFALLVIDQVPHHLGEAILHLAINTVWISALLHGVTAAPAARWYGATLRRMAPGAETTPDHPQAAPASKDGTP